MEDYRTERGLIMSCSLDMAKSIILYRKELLARSPIEIPKMWPSIVFKNFLPLYIEHLEREEPGLYLWIIADLQDKRMMGDLVLQVNDEESGIFVMNFLDSGMEQLFLKECLILLLGYVIKQQPFSIQKLTTESNVSNSFRNETLKQLGFILEKSEGLHLNWSFEFE